MGGDNSDKTIAGVKISDKYKPKMILFEYFGKEKDKKYY